jgi:hypothetical protein
MPIQLASLERLATAEVPFRGGRVTLHQLTTRDAQAIDRQCPIPVPGGRTPHERAIEAKHPTFAARHLDALIRRRVLVVAAALRVRDLHGTPWTPRSSPEWCADVVDALVNRMTEAELAYLHRHLERIEHRAWTDAGLAIGTDATAGN